jgi:hypothetical protein
MDSVAAFVVGFMHALGQPVLGYTNVTADYRERAEIYRRAPPTSLDAGCPDAEIVDFAGARRSPSFGSLTVY